MAEPKQITIQYNPRTWAERLHTTLVRWIVLVLHRRAGKTTAALNHLIRDCLKNNKTRYAYIAPTRVDAKRIVWGMVKEYTAPILGKKYNESELTVTFANGSELLVVGSDNPDSLRGIALWGCFLDEYPMQSPIIFTEIVTKCLADHLGYCIFGGTPKGKGHFFKVFQIAQKDPAWCLIYKTIDDSLKEEEGEVIRNLKQALADDRELVRQGVMTQDEFDQEWYCSFEAAIKGAIYREEITLARKEKRITQMVPHDPELMVYTVWDLGISKGNSMAIGWFQKGASQVRMIHYYENIGEGLAHYIKYANDIARERGFIYAKHFAPHDIKVRELGTGKTRYDTALSLKWKFELDAKGMSGIPRVSIEDGIDKAKMFWKKLYICPTYCEVFLDLIGGYHRKYDKLRNVFLEPEHDFTSNAADMLRYASLVEDQFDNEINTEAPTPKIETPKDEYVGEVDPTSSGRNPMLEGVDIGTMGHISRPKN